MHILTEQLVRLVLPVQLALRALTGLLALPVQLVRQALTVLLVRLVLPVQLVQRVRQVLPEL